MVSPGAFSPSGKTPARTSTSTEPQVQDSTKTSTIACTRNSSPTSILEDRVESSPLPITILQEVPTTTIG